MLNLESPVAFLATNDADASLKFYRDVLGIPLVADEPFALVFDLGPIQLRIQKVEELAPSQATVLGWEVDAVETAVAVMASKGVKFERFPHMDQDANGVWTSPSGTRVAWFRDPCKQLLSITSQA